MFFFVTNSIFLVFPKQLGLIQNFNVSTWVNFEARRSLNVFGVKIIDNWWNSTHACEWCYHHSSCWTHLVIWQPFLSQGLRVQKGVLVTIHTRSLSCWYRIGIIFLKSWSYLPNQNSCLSKWNSHEKTSLADLYNLFWFSTFVVTKSNQILCLTYVCKANDNPNTSW